MVFSSVFFLFFFLPIVILVFYTIRSELRFTFLLLASLVFYFIGENYLIWVMLTSTIIDYVCGVMIAGGFKKELTPLVINGERTLAQKTWLLFSIISNLGLLSYFKYFNFFTDNASRFLHLIGMSSSGFDSFAYVALPLGISFYTFQSMSYTIDVYRGYAKANRNPINFGLFVTMFPQLVAGPIVRYTDIEEQLVNHKLRSDDFAEGVKRFIVGLGKKVLIANTMAQIADCVYELPAAEVSFLDAWIGTLAYALQIYFDFSGYSCMAIGLGKMFGFHFPENFNYPYTSKTIKDFWRRWHMTLSNWFRDYLYIPIGGNHKNRLTTVRNLFVVFVLCGFWHGAAWNFLLFGLFHGTFLSLERVGLERLLKRLPTAVQHLYAIVIISFGWVLFRASSANQIRNMFESMFSSNIKLHPMLTEQLSPHALVMSGIGLLFTMPIYRTIEHKTSSLGAGFQLIGKWMFLLLLMLIFALAAKNLSLGSFNPFIYYRF